MYNNNYNARVVPEFMAYGGTPVGIPTGAVPQNATGGAIPQWALGQQNQNQDQPQPTTQFAQNNMQANDGTKVALNSFPNTIVGYGKILPQPDYSQQNSFPDLGLAVLKNQIKSFEEKVPYPYKDVGGLPTWGYGHMDATKQGFLSQPWINKSTGLPATEQEKQQEYNKFLQLPYGQNYGANYYKDKTNLFLSDDYMNTLVTSDVAAKNNALRNFPYYNNFSQTIKNALIDSEFNTGKVVSGYPLLHEEAGKIGEGTFDLNAFCGQLHREDSSNSTMQQRNNWTINQCLNGYLIPRK